MFNFSSPPCKDMEAHAKKPNFYSSKYIGFYEYRLSNKSGYLTKVKTFITFTTHSKSKTHEKKHR